VTQEAVLKYNVLNCKSEDPIVTRLSICSDFWKLWVWFIIVESDSNSPFHLLASNLSHEKIGQGNLYKPASSLPPYLADCKLLSFLPHYQNSDPRRLERVVPEGQET